MSKKFHLPTKYNKSENKEIIDWYEDKLALMERRQADLSKRLTDINKKGKLH